MLMCLINTLFSINHFQYRSQEPPTYWEPGEVLPVTSSDDVDEESCLLNSDMQNDQIEQQDDIRQNTAVIDLLKAFQANIDKHMTSVGTKLDGIQSRMNDLEARQKSLENEVHDSTSLSSSTNSSPVVSKGKRRRVTPTALQVQCII